jgi:hypothetical protein
MWKVVKKVIGIGLAIWGAVRAPVDLMESLKATRHYAELLYCYRYSAFAFVPRSFWFTLSLLIVGFGLIFSDRWLPILDRWWPRNPNIKLHRVLNAGVTWDDRNECYFRQPNPEHPVIAIILEIANEVEHRKPSPTAGRVKAQITYHSTNKDKAELRVVPGAWVDEPLSSVELDCGDTRWLIAAVSFHFTQDWRVPVNRRSDIRNPKSFDHHEIDGLTSRRGTLDVQLISMDTNKIITTFTFDWQWTTGYPLTLTRYKGIKDS